MRESDKEVKGFEEVGVDLRGGREKILGFSRGAGVLGRLQGIRVETLGCFGKPGESTGNPEASREPRGVRGVWGRVESERGLGGVCGVCGCSAARQIREG